MGLQDDLGKIGDEIRRKREREKAMKEAAKQAEKERAKEIIRHQESKEQGMI